MLKELAPTVRTAVEGGAHAVAETGVPAEVVGVTMFIMLMVLLFVSMSFANRGLTPEAGEHEDPAELPADERALLHEYDAKRHS